MKFGKTLQQSIYPPWKDKYLDYGKLKALLREDVDEDEDRPWTEEDENRFCDEIFNAQLEKVAEFQQEQFDALRDRVDATFDKLKDLIPAQGDSEAPKGEINTGRLKELESELDDITNQVKELKKYSNINYTGFLKIVKKHDRKRGHRYKVRPMMQLSLAQRPFNSEQGYSPLLNKLSIMYYAIRQQLEGDTQAPLDLEVQGETHGGDRYTAHKCKEAPIVQVDTGDANNTHSLDTSGQPSRSSDPHSSSFTCPRVQPAGIQGARRQRQPFHYLTLFR
jgi:SPX domain protein involved in polyphosphate accumulation